MSSFMHEPFAGYVLVERSSLFSVLVKRLVSVVVKCVVKDQQVCSERSTDSRKIHEPRTKHTPLHDLVSVLLQRGGAIKENYTPFLFSRAKINRLDALNNTNPG